MEQICADLSAEHADLDSLVAPLDGAAWNLPTPAASWAIRDQVSHLGFFDRTAVMAITDPDAFAAGAAALLAEGIDRSVEPGRERSPSELLAWWRDGRTALLEALGPLDPRARVPWYGPPMSARSFATARLMETWAHGQDVADALGVERRPTKRLRHVAHLGVRARPFSYAIRGLPLPVEPVAVVLAAPDGDTWSWDEAADAVIAGPALDFCLVVTQRRHPVDVELQVVGDRAREWLAIAQAFAGPPGAGRQPSR